MILKEAKCDKTVFLTPSRTLIVQDGQGEEEIFKGRDEGERRGYAKAVEELRRFTTLLHTIADKLIEQKKAMLNQLKPEVIDFSLEIAEKVIRKELSDPKAHEKLINSLLNQAIKTFSGESLTVYLASDDLVMFQERCPLQGGNINYAEDAMLQCGDCRIEAKSGVLTAHISRELEDLRAKFS